MPCLPAVRSQRAALDREALGGGRSGGDGGVSIPPLFIRRCLYTSAILSFPPARYQKAAHTMYIPCLHNESTLIATPPDPSLQLVPLNHVFALLPREDYAPQKHPVRKKLQHTKRCVQGCGCREMVNHSPRPTPFDNKEKRRFSFRSPRGKTKQNISYHIMRAINKKTKKYRGTGMKTKN